VEGISQDHDDYGRIVVATGFIRHGDESIGQGGEVF
jgi:hypothetical protein